MAFVSPDPNEPCCTAAGHSTAPNNSICVEKTKTLRGIGWTCFGFCHHGIGDRDPCAELFSRFQPTGLAPG